jgi:plasmid maintenance system antidote protein VapI
MSNSIILKDLSAALGLSVNAFEAAIGAKTSTISVAIRRQSRIKEETIEKILKTFPQVSKQWLLTGEGDMFLSQSEKENMAQSSTNAEQSDISQVIDREDIKALIKAAAAIADTAKTAAEAALTQARNNERLTMMVNAGYKQVPESEVNLIDANALHDELRTSFQVLKQYVISQAMLSRGIDLENALKEFDTIEHVFYNQIQKMDKQNIDTHQDSR